MLTFRSVLVFALVLGGAQAGFSTLPAPILKHASAPMRLRGGGWFGLGSKILQFDSSMATDRVKKVWKHEARFGMEDEPYHIYFEEIISDRFALTKGLQLIRDELLLAFNRPNHRNEDQNLKISDVMECAADLTIPSVLSTCAYTVCGDRICQSSSLRDYNCAVRPFASFQHYHIRVTESKQNRIVLTVPSLAFVPRLRDGLPLLLSAVNRSLSSSSRRAEGRTPAPRLRM
jgi:hypothetical protein